LIFDFFFFQRQLPKEGWDDITIEHILNELSLMDSNNFLGKELIFEGEGGIFG
jgi:O-phospho-L-seryl-tRNASec:L-selenocysteinyl-tRNA synthase